MKKLLVVAALFFSGAVSAPGAAATTYDVVASFGTASPFSFGSGIGAGFTVLPNFAADNCVGTSGLACYNNNAGQYTFPAIGKNISASDPLVFFTNVLPKDMLFVQSLPGQTATVRFTAPTTSTYFFSGAFTRIDNSNGSGDGVNVGYAFDAYNFPSYLGTTYLNSQSFFGPLNLAAGTSVDFYVDALGNTNNDGTGFALSVTNVPEPATWGLMVAGFGMVGFAARRRATTVAA